MNKSIIDFYLAANNLKSVIRTGWKEVGVPDERIESVAEHIYGCLVLSIAIASEKNLTLNMEKVFKMLVTKELKKVVPMYEVSINSSDDNDGRASVANITAGLMKQDELLSLYDEFEAQKTEEAKFVLHVSKLESDLQAKIYELNDDFKLENALEDVKNYPGDLSSEILPQVKNASDGWILYNRRYYDNEVFTGLSKDIQDLTK